MKIPIIITLCFTMALTTLCLTNALGGSDDSDHHSTLSKADYARGHLREKDTITRMTPRLTKELADKGLKLGDPVFIRIFKETRKLELWVRHRTSGKFRHFKTWNIAAMSGQLGPKLAEGDFQAPEGFYHVGRSRMKPNSKYHLAFNIGYPNTYDIAHQRTGSFIMVHGNRVSIGCFAMTDPSIEEIYTLCSTALSNGQPYFRVHSFPFHMTAKRLGNETDHPSYDFWLNLKEGYDWFEKHLTPPVVSVRDKQYKFR